MTGLMHLPCHSAMSRDVLDSAATMDATRRFRSYSTTTCTSNAATECHVVCIILSLLTSCFHYVSDQMCMHVPVAIMLAWSLWLQRSLLRRRLSACFGAASPCVHPGGTQQTLQPHAFHHGCDKTASEAVRCARDLATSNHRTLRVNQPMCGRCGIRGARQRGHAGSSASCPPCPLVLVEGARKCALSLS